MRSSHPIVTLAAVLLTASLAAAQPTQPPPSPTMLKRVGIDQKLGQAVPLDLTFRDETGAAVPLRQYFGRKPVVLVLVYYGCPSLCTTILNGTLASFKPLAFDVGGEFEVVTVSIDPTETPKDAAAKKASYLKQYNRPGADAGWHFLTGDADNIRRLAGAVGYRYVYDENTGQYAHGSAIMVLTPDGRLSRYPYGVEFAPRDLRLALVEASESRIGNLADELLLLCYEYDPTSGKYGFAIMATLRAAGGLTVLLLGSFIGVKLWRERRAAPAASNRAVAAPPPPAAAATGEATS